MYFNVEAIVFYASVSIVQLTMKLIMPVNMGKTAPHFLTVQGKSVALLSASINTLCSANTTQPPRSEAWWYTGLGPGGGVLHKWVCSSSRERGRSERGGEELKAPSNT